MDNLTHSLVGLVAAKAGLERLSPGATSLCIIAANAPDSDITVLLFSDRWSFLQHHRGITHAVVGTACLALIIPLIFLATDYLISRIRRRDRVVNIKGLLVASIIVSVTHPLMDWTNNYGIRFWLPWSGRWSYGDFVFIVDPFIWLLLGGTAFLLTSTSRSRRLFWLGLAIVLTCLVVLAPRSVTLTHAVLMRSIWIGSIMLFIGLFVNGIGLRLGPRLAVGSFLVLVLYWSFLFVIHNQVVGRARAEAQTMVQSDGESIIRLAAMPTLANPFTWDCVFETEAATYRFQVNLFQGGHKREVRYEKPDATLTRAISSFEDDRRLQIFLGFARFPTAQFENENCATQTLVEFADLRYTEPGSSRGTFSLDLPVDCPNNKTSR